MIVDLETFKKLYFQEFGTALTDEDAKRKAQALKKIYVSIYGSPEIKQDNNYVKNTNRSRPVNNSAD